MAKQPTAWARQDGTTILTAGNTGVQRLQENSVVRITEAGVTRLLEDIIATPKAPAVWTQL